MIEPAALPAHITVSVVSHGHGAQVDALLGELAALGEARLKRVIVTLNRPEPDWAARWRAHDWPFDLLLAQPPEPLGFGANHNRAFALDGQAGGGQPLFAVLNPDLRLRGNPLAALAERLDTEPRAGLAYPLQIDAAGHPQDHERLLPTPARLLRRHLLGRVHELAAGQAPDWVNAACLLLRRAALAQIDGFDERYHMYCEDVDLCLRLQEADWRLVRADAAVVEHAAQRDSRRRLRPLLWHVRSLLRLWGSPAWRAWRARPAPRAAAHGSAPHR